MGIENISSGARGGGGGGGRSGARGGGWDGRQVGRGGGVGATLVLFSLLRVGPGQEVREEGGGRLLKLLHTVRLGLLLLDAGDHLLLLFPGLRLHCGGRDLARLLVLLQVDGGGRRVAEVVRRVLVALPLLEQRVPEPVLDDLLGQPGLLRHLVDLRLRRGVVDVEVAAENLQLVVADPGADALLVLGGGGGLLHLLLGGHEAGVQHAQVQREAAGHVHTASGHHGHQR